MPTRPIGAGTCNLSVNVPLGWRASLGRLAFTKDVSMGELVRRMIARAAYIWGAARFAAQAGDEDIEAASLLRRAMADGIGPEDRPAIERALALVLRSAERDRDLAARINLAEAGK